MQPITTLGTYANESYLEVHFGVWDELLGNWMFTLVDKTIRRASKFGFTTKP